MIQPIHSNPESSEYHVNLVEDVSVKLVFVTSLTKYVTFCVVLVCLSVCLLVSNITQNVMKFYRGVMGGKRNIFLVVIWIVLDE